MVFYKTTFIDKITKKRFLLLTGSVILRDRKIYLEITSDSHPFYKGDFKKDYFDTKVDKFIKRISGFEIDGN
ncbi:50S ribosomal protein L31 [Candidatus Vidania fulgoroideorum]